MPTKIETLFGFKTIPENQKMEAELRKIKATSIVVRPQVREEFDPDEIRSLADSIKEVGLLEPLTVISNLRGTEFTLLHGERRYRALRLLHAHDFDDLYIECKIPFDPETTDEGKELQQIVDNYVRLDLNIEEVSKAIRKLYGRGMPLEKVATALGKSKSLVSMLAELGDVPHEFMPLFKMTQDYSLLYNIKKFYDQHNEETRQFIEQCVQKGSVSRQAFAEFKESVGSEKLSPTESDEKLSDTEENENLSRTEKVENLSSTVPDEKTSRTVSGSDTETGDEYGEDNEKDWKTDDSEDDDKEENNYDIDDIDDEDDKTAFKTPLSDSSGTGKTKTYSVKKILSYDRAADKLVCLLENSRQVEVSAYQIKVQIELK